MKNTLYDRRRATALLPLLNSITREIQERQEKLDKLEDRIASLSGNPRNTSDHLDLIAEAATHRRELRHAKEELLKLGCSIVGTAPITIRIPGQRGSERRSFVYQSGDPVLR